jgi:hypothetical protein
VQIIKSFFSTSATNKTSGTTDFVAVLIVIFITLGLLGISFPLLRDFVLARIDTQSLNWITANKSKLIPWVDWLRIAFEVALALFVSNQVFNEQLQKLFERSLERLKANLTSTIEDSIKRDDARVRIKKAINEIIAFLYLPTNLRALPSDIPILFNASWNIYHGMRRGMPRLFLRLLALRVLGAFSGKLHATAALMAFWGVLLMKVLRLYLDAPILNVPIPK